MRSDESSVKVSDSPRPCVKCGYCCAKGVCAFGEWDESIHQCRHLTAGATCAIYDLIVSQPGADKDPVFGAGCCSPMNSERQKKIDEAKGS